MVGCGGLSGTQAQRSKQYGLAIKLVEGVTWVASGDSGHGLVLDGSPAIGGQNLGMRPMELVLVNLGGCSAMDMITILRSNARRSSIAKSRSRGRVRIPFRRCLRRSICITASSDGI